jgi:hypothetical protein
MDSTLRARLRAFQIEPTEGNAAALGHAYARSQAGETGDRDTRKVLVSPGFGAGWSTWSRGETGELMTEFAPIIAALEAGETLTESHPAVVALVSECEERFGDSPYLGGLVGLRVETVTGPYRVTEYDGSESIETLAGSLSSWT